MAQQQSPQAPEPDKGCLGEETDRARRSGVWQRYPEVTCCLCRGRQRLSAPWARHAQPSQARGQAFCLRPMTVNPSAMPFASSEGLVPPTAPERSTCHLLRHTTGGSQMPPPPGCYLSRILAISNPNRIKSGRLPQISLLEGDRRPDRGRHRQAILTYAQ